MNKSLVSTLILTSCILLICFSVSMADKDLVIHLPMDGNSDTDALRDRSGNNVRARTHGNPKWKRSGGRDGKGAFEFDGDDDISVGDRFPLNSSYTKAAWIYWTGNGGRGAGNNIISGDGNKGGHAFWFPKLYGNRLSAGHNSHWNIVQDKSPLKRNKWYFVALTYDCSSGEMILYKNAVKVGSAKVKPADRNVTDPTISIGSFGYKNGWMIQGVVDDVRIYKRALSAGEIVGIFKKGGIIAKQSKPGEASPKPKPQEKRVKGFVVWESNRTGQWELYRANTDGSGLKKLTQLAKTYRIPYDGYLRPRISPDGKTVLFGYGRRGAPVEVWIVPSNGGKSRKLAVGNPLNWSSYGKQIYFVRNRQIWQYELATGKESLLHKVKVPVDGRDGSMVGDIRPDLKAAVFRTGKSNEYFIFGKGKTIKRMGGCEPAFSSDGRYIYWVQGPRDFRVWDTKNNKERTLLGKPSVERWNYTYFPRVSSDSRWIVYGASPNQHNHSSSDYEIFLQELKNWRPVGKPIRLSRNKRTDRWGEMWAGK